MTRIHVRPTFVRVNNDHYRRINSLGMSVTQKRPFSLLRCTKERALSHHDESVRLQHSENNQSNTSKRGSSSNWHVGWSCHTLRGIGCGGEGGGGTASSLGQIASLAACDGGDGAESPAGGRGGVAGGSGKRVGKGRGSSERRRLRGVDYTLRVLDNRALSALSSGRNAESDGVARCLLLCVNA